MGRMSLIRSRHEAGQVRATSSSSSCSWRRLSKERRRWRMVRLLPVVRLELRSRTGRVHVRHLLLLLLLLRRGWSAAARLSRIPYRHCRCRRVKLLLLLLLLSKLVVVVVVRRRKGWGCMATIAAAVHPKLLRLLMRMRMLQMRRTTTTTRDRLLRRRRRRHRQRRW